MWRYRSLFLVHEHSLVSAWSVCAIWDLANPTTRSVLQQKGTGFLPLKHKGMHSWQILHNILWVRPTGREKLTPTVEAVLAYSLLQVSKAEFYSVLHCFVFSLVTQMPRCNGIEVFWILPGTSNLCTVPYSLGIDNQHMVLCSTAFSYSMTICWQYDAFFIDLLLHLCPELIDHKCVIYFRILYPVSLVYTSFLWQNHIILITVITVTLRFKISTYTCSPFLLLSQHCYGCFDL